MKTEENQAYITQHFISQYKLLRLFLDKEVGINVEKEPLPDFQWSFIV